MPMLGLTLDLRSGSMTSDAESKQQMRRRQEK